ncbi:MAG TPA: glutamine synthetase family protein [Solirubrobacteraceae bacterium]|jgi:glutamine synthetase|nr:glutamine synthetase family protein [Solirubrobacteraceae bacterium]
MNDYELVALVCCDLGAIVRGRSLPSDRLSVNAELGVGWVPANNALTPAGTLAEPNPFGSTGDLRLLPDLETHVRVEAERTEDSALSFVLCDIAEIDGRPWQCCPRSFLREALRRLEAELGLRVTASFEHEFQLLAGSAAMDDPASAAPAALPFSLEAQRLAGAFPERVMAALEQAEVAPERFMPEYASHQFEIPVAAAEGLAAADRAVVLREVVRETARREGRRASFTPLLDPSEAGNGVHIHLSLHDRDGRPALYDPARPAGLSELGGRFAAGVLRHAAALTALTAPSPVSAARLAPHRWSAGAVCLGQQNRETLLRIPPLLPAAGEPGEQLRLEYRAADAAANPYLALGAIVLAGLEGVRVRLDPAPVMTEDPTRVAAHEADRYGLGALPGSLTQALQALSADQTARGWLSPLMYEAYLAVKRGELEAADGIEDAELYGRYAAVY